MKTTLVSTYPLHENWDGSRHKMKKLFTWLTGYDIMPEGSREDIQPEKSLKILKSKKIVHSI